MGESKKTLRQRVTTETGLFVGLLFIGFVVMPVAIYFVGSAIFGAYGGTGYGDFFGALSTRIREGDQAAWFLVLSPYLVILVFRLMAWGWGRSAQT